MITPVQAQQSGGVAGVAPVEAKQKLRGPAFSAIFEDAMQAQRAAPQPLRFSNHAVQRMSERSIRLTEADLGRIEQAAREAAAKGARESLLLMNPSVSPSEQCGESRLALVLSVPNRTVITVVPQGEMRDTVFTNIDSAVLVADPPPIAQTTNPGRTPYGEAQAPPTD